MNCFILGTRAEFIKTFPLMLEMDKQKIDYVFVHTGQHDLTDLCKTFGIRLPDIVLTEPPQKTSKFFGKVSKAVAWNLGLVFKIRKEVTKIPDLKYVFFHGDTMTTTSAAIACSKLFNWNKKFKSVHLEAGLRSGNLFEPFPEEISRIIADNLSEVRLLVSSKSKVKGIVVGNTVLDSVRICLQNQIEVKTPTKFAILTLHRHENIKSKERLEKIFTIVEACSIPVLFSLHDNTKKKLEEFGLLERVLNNKNIMIMPNQNYLDFIGLMSKASLLLTDGGSVQEESLILNKPCILLRMATERQEGLDTGINYLSKFEVTRTISKMNEYLSLNIIPVFKNPYGQGNVSKKIIEVLE